MLVSGFEPGIYYIVVHTRVSYSGGGMGDEHRYELDMGGYPLINLRFLEFFFWF
jgi:hypothetical protein